MFLKWPFVNGTGKDLMFIVQISLETEFQQFNMIVLTQKMVLKRQIVSDTIEDFSYSLFGSPWGQSL